MIQRVTAFRPDLYERDETAWLETMAELIAQGQLAELDYAHLAEYLADMAQRDRRQVESRLSTLLVHLLKWNHQRDKRTASWRGTIITQRQKLNRLLGRTVLRNHAETVLAECYKDAVEVAAAETQLPEKSFPTECPYTMDQLLAADVTEDNRGPQN